MDQGNMKKETQVPETTKAADAGSEVQPSTSAQDAKAFEDEVASNADRTSAAFVEGHALSEEILTQYQNFGLKMQPIVQSATMIATMKTKLAALSDALDVLDASIDGMQAEADELKEGFVSVRKALTE